MRIVGIGCKANAVYEALCKRLFTTDSEFRQIRPVVVEQPSWLGTPLCSFDPFRFADCEEVYGFASVGCYKYKLILLKRMRKWLTSVRSERVAFTGRAWDSRAKIQRIVQRQGGIPSQGGEVTGITTVLVRGDSSVWAFGEYGTKERKAAGLVRKGASISLVHDSEFRKLLESGTWAAVSDRIAGEPVRWLAPVTKRQFERAAIHSGPLDREHTVLGRVEQSYLRHILFGQGENAACSLCGRRLPVGLLIAAHIKPRSECSRRERLDVENIVFSACLLGCDALYERGLVAVQASGPLVVSSVHSSSALKAAMRVFRGRSCSAWNETRARYFKWHLTRRFQGANAAS